MPSNKLTTFMYGMLYPAVLGSVIVAVAIRVATPNWTSDQFLIGRASLGTLFLLFFFFSYVNSEDAKKYDAWTFVCDFVDVLAMFIAFWSLGLFSDSTKNEPNFDHAYVALIILVPFQLIWRKVAKVEDVFLLIELRASALGALVAGLLFYPKFGFVIPVTSGFAAVLLVLYQVAPMWYIILSDWALWE